MIRLTPEAIAGVILCGLVAGFCIGYLLVLNGVL